MTDAEPTMTTADIIAEFDRLNSEWAALMARARAAVVGLETSSVSQDDSPPTDLMRPGAAIHEFGLARSTLHRLCRAHPLGTAAGFAVFDCDRRRTSTTRWSLACGKATC